MVYDRQYYDFSDVILIFDIALDWSRETHEWMKQTDTWMDEADQPKVKTALPIQVILKKINCFTNGIKF